VHEEYPGLQWTHLPVKLEALVGPINIQASHDNSLVASMASSSLHPRGTTPAAVHTRVDAEEEEIENISMMTYEIAVYLWAYRIFQ
jgi:hypothetical protein